MIKEKELLLAKIGRCLNESNVLWGVGASMMLYYKGLVKEPKDIDFIVDKKDIEKVDRLLSELGEKTVREKSSFYATTYFYEYNIDGIEVDVMCEFTICNHGLQYLYDFNEQSVVEMAEIEGEQIPFTGLEDWYVLYQIMPGREQRVNLIEDFFVKNGVSHPNLLIKMKEQVLPEFILQNIDRLLLQENSRLGS